MIEKAKEHHVTIHEDDVLAEILSQLELNQEIPHELYSMIAEIFALVYRAEKMAERGNLS
ncbi:EscU/YscU/HrcU family type III secretion system export apparatus switch protein [Tepidibacillus marianensis]|uniref:EscU/YscU/HrcU family type III secretion system export apparatus switch protein n=1 Tax=Tepidibacillus marianensis TaxID=3131995 RepID=UPI0030CF545E